MSDYSFMKTGFSANQEEVSQETIINITSLFLIFTEDALKIAGIYTIHGGRKVVTTKDIIKSMKIRTIYSNTFWNLPGTKERIESMVNELNSSDEKIDEETEEMDEETEESDVNTTICNCPVCNLFVTIKSQWRVWTPSNIQDKMLKNRIDEML